MSPSPEDLRALAEKYRTLAVLRGRREELEQLGRAGFGDEEGEARRKAFRKVAQAFPGALRELDACSAELLARKAAAVETAAAGGTLAAWMPLVLDFHRALREALAVKLWLATHVGRAGLVTEAVVAAYLAAHPERAEAVDRSFLERHHRPPAGRLLGIVFARLGPVYDLSPDQIRAAVFGDPTASEPA